MGRHRRHCPLIRLLARLGWQRDPDLWSVPCRDIAQRRSRIAVRLSSSGIAVTAPPDGAVLNVLEVGRLRAALADATRTLGHLSSGPDHHRPQSARPTDPAAPVPPRRRISLRPPPRPTVQDITARLTQTPPTEEGASHADRPHRTPHTGRAA